MYRHKVSTNLALRTHDSCVTILALHHASVPRHYHSEKLACVLLTTTKFIALKGVLMGRDYAEDFQQNAHEPQAIDPPTTINPFRFHSPVPLQPPRRGRHRAIFRPWSATPRVGEVSAASSPPRRRFAGGRQPRPSPARPEHREKVETQRQGG